jgi:predicted dehydrogenase
MKKIRVGLYGNAGHQVQGRLADNPRADLVAVGAMGLDALPGALRARPDIQVYADLDALLADPAVDLVSLCSARRRDQAGHAIRCLEAGKHVYAEKPCAMTESDLDNILATAGKTGCAFHEMAGTAFEQPYLAMRECVAAGRIGTVVQVIAQKAYPYIESRPSDEDVDGGLLMQVGVHALRFVEHVAGVKIEEILPLETGLGNPGAPGLCMAATLNMRLANGGLAVATMNYLNSPGFHSWGYEVLRIFGTEGFIEARDAGKDTRLVLREGDVGAVPGADRPARDYFDMFLASLVEGEPMPLDLEDELHPTRMVIRAKGTV